MTALEVKWSTVHTTTPPGGCAEMNGEADAPTVAHVSPVGSSYSNVQTRPASLKHSAGPRSLEAACDASDVRRQLRATPVAGDASHCAAASERADLLGEELTCILEFLNAKVVASARERVYVRSASPRMCAQIEVVVSLTWSNIPGSRIWRNLWRLRCSGLAGKA